MKNRAKRNLCLLLLPLSLFSCASQPEEPQPFPYLRFYQGIYYSSFGSKTVTQFISSVPIEDGSRVSIEAVQDTYYSNRGFLLYICTLVGRPEEYRLYKYDYEVDESEYIAPIYPTEDPHFYPLSSDYSPCFIVSNGASYAYAFLDKDERAFACEKGFVPTWAGEQGYVTAAYYEDFGQGLYYGTEQNIFHFYDGSELSLENGVRVLSCGEDALLYQTKRDMVINYNRKDASTFSYGGYALVQCDRNYPSSRAANPCPYLWRVNPPKNIISISKILEGAIERKDYPYDSSLSNVDFCRKLGNTEHFFLSDDRKSILIDLEKDTYQELETTTNWVTGATSVNPFEHVLYEGNRYRLIEDYRPSSSNTSSIYAVVKETGNKVLVQAGSKPLFSFQRIEELEHL